MDARLHQLQDDYLRGDPEARADLARLRRGIGKPAGSVPQLWRLTLGSVPESLRGNRDEPNRAEQAAHAALTLFALHQQSMPVAAHIPGIRVGRAVGVLRNNPHRTKAVTRRFMAVATAASIDEVLTHLRGLITQLRGERQGLDYAALADDFVGLLTPTRAKTVRLAWGRDFYRNLPDHPPADTTTPTTPNKQ